MGITASSNHTNREMGDVLLKKARLAAPVANNKDSPPVGLVKPLFLMLTPIKKTIIDEKMTMVLLSLSFSLHNATWPIITAPLSSANLTPCLQITAPQTHHFIGFRPAPKSKSKINSRIRE